MIYLRRILKDGILSFLSGDNKAHPDLVIETRDKPLILEIGAGKTSIRQFKQSNVQRRYGSLVSDGITEPALATAQTDCILLPLNWFLLL